MDRRSRWPEEALCLPVPTLGIHVPVGRAAGPGAGAGRKQGRRGDLNLGPARGRATTSAFCFFLLTFSQTER